MTRRRDIPLPCDPIGLSREESAAYVGVSLPTFDAMVKDGSMPTPKKVRSRRIWDREALRIAFKALPGGDEGNDWDESDGALEARAH